MKKALWLLSLGLLVITAVGGCGTSSSSDTTTTTTVATTTTTTATTTTTETSTTTTTTSTTTSTLAGYSVTGSLLIGECTYESALFFLTPTSELVPGTMTIESFVSGVINFNVVTTEAGNYCLMIVAPIPVDDFNPEYVSAIGLTTGEENAFMEALAIHVITFEGAYRTENVGDLTMYRLISAPSVGSISGNINWPAPTTSADNVIYVGYWTSYPTGNAMPTRGTWEVIGAGIDSWDYTIADLADGDYYLLAVLWPDKTTPQDTPGISMLSGDRAGSYDSDHLPTGWTPGFGPDPEEGLAVAVEVAGADVPAIELSLKYER